MVRILQEWTKLNKPYFNDNYIGTEVQEALMTCQKEILSDVIHYVIAL